MKVLSYTSSDLRDGATRRAVAGDLADFTESDLVGLAENPRARSDDVLLLVGQDQGRPVAVLGMIPDTLFLRGETIHFAWMHKWAAGPARVGARRLEPGLEAPGEKPLGAGTLLFLAAAQAYRDQIGVSGCTAAAERVFRRTGRLVDLRIKHGASLYLRTNASRVVPEKYPAAARLSPLLRLADRSANLLLSIRMGRWRRRASDDGVSSVHLDRIDPETARFIEEVRSPELFRRGAEELNWIKNGFPEQGREDRFVRVHERGGRIVGFFYVAFRAGTLTTPYVFCRREDTEPVVRAILRECQDGDARDILAYDDAITAAIERLGFPTLHRRRRQKLFLISNLYLGEDFSTCVVHDGDGDAFIG
jgi:hypothetical protein